MKRTESPVVDYDSDPVLKQVKENYEKKLQEIELQTKSATEIVKEMDLLSEQNIDSTLKWIGAMVCKNSDDPEKIFVRVEITTPYHARKILNKYDNSIVLATKCEEAMLEFRQKIVDQWNEEHPLLVGRLKDGWITIQNKK